MFITGSAFSTLTAIELYLVYGAHLSPLWRIEIKANWTNEEITVWLDNEERKEEEGYNTLHVEFNANSQGILRIRMGTGRYGLEL